ncbi:hypothetical protein ABIA35_002505 [Catenulispora sp. MAP12-49]|uniref:hypothetical protein n=1 Tax=Catenulispora sp. MAP12-49 TaxID=3156302 RepID=UPI0035133691
MIAPNSGLAAPAIFELIPGKDFLVISRTGSAPLPDDEELEEIRIHADQRCAPPTLGPVSDAVLNVAEAVAGGVTTYATTTNYPAMRAYLKRLIAAVHHREAADAAGAPEASGVPAEAATTEVEQAVTAVAGRPVKNIRLEAGPDGALHTVVAVKDDMVVDVASDPTGQVVCITFRTS